MEHDQMRTLSQIMAKLSQEKGIHREFRINEDGEMKLQDSEKIYKPEDLEIIKTYRFEGMSNPDDNAVLYVLQDKQSNKGIIVDSYGAESNFHGEKFDDFLRKIPVQEHEDF